MESFSTTLSLFHAVCFANDACTSKSYKTRRMSRYVGIRIGALGTDASRELEVARLISTADPHHEGLGFLSFPSETFQLQRSAGTFGCTVWDPLGRETLRDFRFRFKDKKLPLHLFKLYIFGLLQALDYLHMTYGLVHTGKRSSTLCPPLIVSNVFFDRHPRQQYCHVARK
jgi:hypothetical protein